MVDEKWWKEKVDQILLDARCDCAVGWCSHVIKIKDLISEAIARREKDIRKEIADEVAKLHLETMSESMTRLYPGCFVNWSYENEKQKQEDLRRVFFNSIINRIKHLILKTAV